MAEPNVWVDVADPDALIDGRSQFAPFAVAYIQVYRFASEAAARALTSGTLATTFTLVAVSTQPSDPDIAGPFRFGYYDSSQTAESWYRYRFADSGLATFSGYSVPWQGDGRTNTSLRTLMREVGQLLGGNEGLRAAVTAGSTTTATCAELFKSSLKSSDWYVGGWVFVDFDAAGANAAPQGEERLIASVDTATGVATLDNALSAALANGDYIQVHAVLQPSLIIRAINLVRERMHLILNHDIALGGGPNDGNRYILPGGIYGESDVIDVRRIEHYQDGRWQDEDPIRFEVETDGLSNWLIFREDPQTRVARVRYEMSYRDLEGEMSAMDDTTRAPLVWLRKAACWEAYKLIDESDDAARTFSRLTGIAYEEVSTLSRRYGPQIPHRRAKTKGKLVGPRRVR
jgi:hypothetical protein